MGKGFAITFNTGISDFQVGFEVIVTRSGLWEVLVQYPDAALSPSGAESVHRSDDVMRAADVTEILSHAPVDAHAPVESARNDHQFVVTMTTGAKVFRLTDGLF